MANDKRRAMVIGVALLDDSPPPRFCYGCYYSKLKIEGVAALEAILDQPAVKSAYDAFMDAFGEAASDLGLEAALVAGADPESIDKVRAYKQAGRANKNRGSQSR